MTKKLIAILVAVVLMLSFVACKSNEEAKQGPSSSEEASSHQYDDIVVGDYGEDDTGSEDTFSEDNLDDADVESLWQQMNPTTEIN